MKVYSSRRCLEPVLIRRRRASAGYGQARRGRSGSMRRTQGVSEGEVEEDGPRGMVAVDDEVGAVRIAGWDVQEVVRVMKSRPLHGRYPAIPHVVVEAIGGTSPEAGPRMYAVGVHGSLNPKP